MLTLPRCRADVLINEVPLCSQGPGEGCGSVGIWGARAGASSWAGQEACGAAAKAWIPSGQAQEKGPRAGSRATFQGHAGEHLQPETPASAFGPVLRVEWTWLASVWIAGNFFRKLQSEGLHSERPEL